MNNKKNNNDTKRIGDSLHSFCRRHVAYLFLLLLLTEKEILMVGAFLTIYQLQPDHHHVYNHFRSLPMPLLFSKSDENHDDENIMRDVVNKDEKIVNILNTELLLPTTTTTTDVNIAYFYLQDTIGLSEEVMWKVTYEAGSALGMTVKNLQTKVALLQRTMNLSKEDIRTILSRHPAILHLSAAKNLSPTILFLVRTLDFSKADLRELILQYPCILAYSISNLRAKIDFFLDILGFSVPELRGLLLSEPKLMCASVKTGFMPRFSFWMQVLPPATPKLDLRKLIVANPCVLLYSVENNLHPKIVSYFYQTLQFTPHDLLYKVLMKYPSALNYNLERHIEPMTAYLQTELEYSPMELRRIWCKFPRIVTYSLYKMKHVVGYFRYTLEMDATQVKRVFFQAPQILGLNTDTTLADKVRFLSTQLNTSKEELRTILVGMPTLLLCSSEKNLQPKILYLQQMLDNTDQVKELLLIQPTLLGYSLDKRIRPRLERLKECDIPITKITVGIPMKETKFEEWLFQKHWKLNKNSTTPTKFIHRDSSSNFPQTTRNLASSTFSKGTKEQDVLDPLNDKNNDISETDPITDRKGRIVHWRRPS